MEISVRSENPSKVIWKFGKTAQNDQSRHGRKARNPKPQQNQQGNFQSRVKCIQIRQKGRASEIKTTLYIGPSYIRPSYYPIILVLTFFRHSASEKKT